MRYALVLLVALATLACGGAPAPAPMPAPQAPAPRELRVYVDVSAGARAEVEAGIRGWARVSASWRVWQIVNEPEGAELTIVELGAESEPCGVSADARYSYAGCATVGAIERGEHATVTLVAGRYEHAARLVVMHEIGHVLGVPHIPGTIMNDVAEETDLHFECPDPETAAIASWHVRSDAWEGCPWPSE